MHSEAGRGFLRLTIEERNRHLRRRSLWRGVLFLVAAAVSAAAGVLVSNLDSSAPKEKSATSSLGRTMTLSTLPNIQLMGLMAPGDSWAANGVHLYFTRDNGVHWALMTDPPVSGDLVNSLDGFASLGRNDLWFGSYSRSYGTCGHVEPPDAAGATAVIYPFVRFTINGGTTWQQATLPKCGLLTGLQFLNATHGWAFVTNNRSESIDTTNDGGLHWRSVGSLPLRASIDFSSTEDGWATAISGDNAYVTTDGGATWRPLVLPIPPSYRMGSDILLTPPKFFGTKTGVIGSEMSNGTSTTAVAYVTNDGGQHWITRELPDHSFNANGIVLGQIPMIDPFAAAGPRTWIFYLGPKVYKTIDGGRNWSSLTPKSPWLENATTSLDFVTPSNGWAIQWSGNAGLAFLQTVNGGRTWTALANVSGA